MATCKWRTTVTAVGPEAGSFLEHNIVVLFDTSAPEELAEFAIIHPPAILHAPVVKGDVVLIGERAFRVTAVGSVANANLDALGHVVLKCNGRDEAELPGDICAEAGPLPSIEIGMPIQIVAREGAEG